MPTPLRLFAAFVLLLACASGTPAQPFNNHATGNPATGVINGRVTVNGKPAVNAAVSALAGESQGQAEQVFAKTVTDAAGRYELRNLPAGPFVVRALSAAYVNKNAERYFDRQRLGGEVVTLAAGEQREGVDFELERGGVLTGRVTDAAGKPLPHEQVHVFKLDERGQPGYAVFGDEGFARQTDDRGIYRLYGLPAGRYLLGAGMGQIASDRFGREFGHSKFKLVFYPDAADWRQANVLDVRPGSETAEVDLRLERLDKGGAARAFAVSGRVLDVETGQPVARARLNAYNQAAGGQFADAGGEALSDAQGVFLFPSLRSGKYQLSYAEEPFGPTERPGYYADPQLFEVAEAAVSGLELRLQRGASLSGVVVVEGQPGALRARGQMLSIVTRPDHEELNRAEAEGRSGPVPLNFAFGVVSPTGQFKLNGLRPGRLSFQINELSGDGNGPRYKLARLEHNGANLGRVIEIGAKENLTGLRVVVLRPQGKLRGQLNFSGAALPKDWHKRWQLTAYVMSAELAEALRRNAGGLIGDSDPEYGHGDVDDGGRFFIQGLAPGAYELTLSAVPLGNGVGDPPFEPVQQTVFINAQGETSVAVSVKLQARGRQ